MTSADEVSEAARQAARQTKIGRIAEYGLSDACQESGVVLQGLSAKIQPEDCLVTLRGVQDKSPVVAFVGGESLGSCLIKAYKDGWASNLRWRPDKFAK